jgi:hypothetical protein
LSTASQFCIGRYFLLVLYLTRFLIGKSYLVFSLVIEVYLTTLPVVCATSWFCVCMRHCLRNILKLKYFVLIFWKGFVKNIYVASVHFSEWRRGPPLQNTIISVLLILTVIPERLQNSDTAFSCNWRLCTVSAPHATSSAKSRHEISGISHVSLKWDIKSLMYKLKILGGFTSPCLMPMLHLIGLEIRSHDIFSRLLSLNDVFDTLM